MDQENSTTWLSFKIYTRAKIGHVETLITQLFPEVLLTPGITRWFFVRYWDDGGFHLRLRLLVQNERAGLLSEQTRNVLSAGLLKDDVAPVHYRSMVVPSTSIFTKQVLAASTRIESDVYHPEVELYGAEHMGTAEKLFEHSSVTAIRVLLDEQSNLYSRKTLAPILMKQALDCLSPNDDPTAFWERYTAYWLPPESATSAQWRHRFSIKSSQLSQQGIRILAAPHTLPPAALEHLSEWRIALGVAFNAYATCEGTLGHVPHLAAAFIHLMNNRLGILPLEEAYLATLLLSATAEGPIH